MLEWSAKLVKGLLTFGIGSLKILRALESFQICDGGPFFLVNFGQPSAKTIARLPAEDNSTAFGDQAVSISHITIVKLAAQIQIYMELNRKYDHSGAFFKQW
ncbi:hypothetical protein ABKV19_014102 [Rosa sericea]